MVRARARRKRGAKSKGEKRERITKGESQKGGCGSAGLQTVTQTSTQLEKRGNRAAVAFYAS